VLAARTDAASDARMATAANRRIDKATLHGRRLQNLTPVQRLT
jgi:hypothetical protein